MGREVFRGNPECGGRDRLAWARGTDSLGNLAPAMIRVTRLLPFRLLSLLLVSGLAAAEPVVEMPPFVVTDTPVNERPWRYAEAEGFELISQVGDEPTQQVFAALWRGPRLTLPPELRPRLSTPTAVIILDQDSDRGTGPAALGSVRQKHELGSHWTNVIKRTLPDREIFCINLQGRFFTYSSTFRFDLRTLLALRTPAAPPWLLEALYGVYGLYREGIEYPDRGKATGLVRALWCTEAELNRAEMLAGLAHSHFRTAPEQRRGNLAGPAAALRQAVADPAGLWTGGLPGDQRTAEENARWAATCALFARWALHAEEGRRHDAFWRFAVAAAERPVDEALFRECFGLDFAAARDELAWYLPIAVTEAADRPVAPLVVPRLQLRAATSAEVARVRGDFERGEALVLAGAFPEVAAKYRAKAGRTLRAALAGAPEDARLAGVLALQEHEAGDKGRALELLERATAGREARPRVWFTLAHLRLMGTGEAGAAKSRIGAGEAARILGPLEQAWRQEPAMVVTYELLAELWRRCPDLPAEETIARLKEGQRKFPRNIRFALAALRVCVERGRPDAALAMVESALPFVTEPEMRERLNLTREALRRAPGNPRGVAR